MIHTFVKSSRGFFALTVASFLLLTFTQSHHNPVHNDRDDRRFKARGECTLISRDARDSRNIVNS